MSEIVAKLSELDLAVLLAVTVFCTYFLAKHLVSAIAAVRIAKHTGEVPILTTKESEK